MDSDLELEPQPKEDNIVCDSVGTGLCKCDAVMRIDSDEKGTNSKGTEMPRKSVFRKEGLR